MKEGALQVLVVNVCYQYRLAAARYYLYLNLSFYYLSLNIPLNIPLDIF
jgi:hypothetical protein